MYDKIETCLRMLYEMEYSNLVSGWPDKNSILALVLKGAQPFVSRDLEGSSSSHKNIAWSVNCEVKLIPLVVTRDSSPNVIYSLYGLVTNTTFKTK